MKQRATLERRLATLEKTMPEKLSDADVTKALTEKLERIQARFRGGDLSDSRGRSTIERVALAFERGDGEFALKLMREALDDIRARKAREAQRSR